MSVQNTKDEIPLLPTATFQPSQPEMKRHNLFYHQIKSNTSIFYFTGSSVANPEIRQNRWGGGGGGQETRNLRRPSGAIILTKEFRYRELIITGSLFYAIFYRARWGVLGGKQTLP